MVLQPAMEGMLGLKPDAMSNTLGMSLNFPFDWDSASVDNIRMGDNRFSFKMNRTPMATSVAFNNLLTSSASAVSGSSGLKVFLSIPLPPGAEVEKVLLDGRAATFKRTAGGIEMEITAAEKSLIVIGHTGGISVLPLVHHPEPGIPRRSPPWWGHPVLLQEPFHSDYTTV